MLNQEILQQETISIRTLPVNLKEGDIELFGHELQRKIPATIAIYLHSVIVDSNGVLLQNNKVLSESFPFPHDARIWLGRKARIGLLIKHLLSRQHNQISQHVVWITDTWSNAYFHWITDALPRLLSIRDKVTEPLIMLPAELQKEEFIIPSLRPFGYPHLFALENYKCKDFKMPSHTAPTGNYNEELINGLRSLYAEYYGAVSGEKNDDRIYVSRCNAKKRRIFNEEEVMAVIRRFGFSITCFEDYSFEQQVRIMLDTRYLIGNHGAGLTNMLFMKAGGSILELRREGDSHNNCFFALASALSLKYFYQTCNSRDCEESAYSADLIVDCKRLSANIEQMLSD